mmetsp:Transcript_15777/g.36878  ORF Transcript_15777/g.36878 Transcript_15777/m.36878 type:complete len:263 (+) Transcript_15777:141-929(+)
MSAELSTGRRSGRATPNACTIRGVRAVASASSGVRIIGTLDGQNPVCTLVRWLWASARAVLTVFSQSLGVQTPSWSRCQCQGLHHPRLRCSPRCQYHCRCHHTGLRWLGHYQLRCSFPWHRHRHVIRCALTRGMEQRVRLVSSTAPRTALRGWLTDAFGRIRWSPSSVASARLAPLRKLAAQQRCQSRRSRRSSAYSHRLLGQASITSFRTATLAPWWGFCSLGVPAGLWPWWLRLGGAAPSGRPQFHITPSSPSPRQPTGL